MGKMDKACQRCQHKDNCRIHWGKDCKQVGGKRIPKFKVFTKAMPEPEDWVGKVVWRNGHHEYYTADDLERGRAHAGIG